MRLAKTGVAVDKKRVIQQRRLAGHSLTGGVGKAVGRPHHKGIEGQIIAVILIGILLRDAVGLLGDAELKAYIAAEHILQRLAQKVAVAAQKSLLVEVVGGFDYGHPFFKVYRDGAKPAEPRLIRNVRYPRLAEFADDIPCLIERIQVIYPPVSMFRQWSSLPVPSIKMFYPLSIAYLQPFFKYFSTFLLTFPPGRTIIFLTVILLAVVARHYKIRRNTI